MKIVIVGNGVAGIEAALEARRLLPDATITVVSEESEHFFSRPSLMYLLVGQLRLQDVEPFERDAYQVHRLTRVKARARGIDAAARTLLLEGQPSLAYDRLLIASGSRARPGPWPGGALRGVGAFVTMADLAWLEAELSLRPSGAEPAPGGGPYGARPASRSAHPHRPLRPIVVGGGLIGIEVVETLVALGLKPRFLLRDEWFWPMALNAREAGSIGDKMREHGVELHPNTEVRRFIDDGAGNLAAVETSAGRFDADIATVAIGVVPNTEWLGDSLDLESRSRGVRVDATLSTSVEDVFAAGDCAAVPWYDGTHRPEPLWYTARDQGKVAGQRLAGRATRYDRGLWYNSAKLFDVEYTTVGLVGTSKEHTEVFAEERGPVRSTVRLVFSDGALVGANLLGRRWDHSVLLAWIREGRSEAHVKAHLPDASFDTEFVPPLSVASLRWERS